MLSLSWVITLRETYYNRKVSLQEKGSRVEKAASSLQQLLYTFLTARNGFYNHYRKTAHNENGDEDYEY